MPPVLPTDLANHRLPITRLDPGATFFRIFAAKYSDPLGFGSSPSRFSDPRRRVARNRFGVFYGAPGFATSFREVVIRDQFDGQLTGRTLSEAALAAQAWAEIAVTAPLVLVDLCGDGPQRIGMPTDVLRARRQGAARRWALEFHRHPDGLDGIAYPSRLDGSTNFALFDRALAKVKAIHRVDGLLGHPDVADLLDKCQIGLVA